ASAEVTVGTIRPDVLAHFAVEPVAIEIFVAHQVPRAKIEAFASRHLPAVEIDLRPFRHADLPEDRWRATVIDVAARAWLYPPKQAREENDRRRQEAIATQRQHERELEAAIARAERMHNRAVQEYRERMRAHAIEQRKAAEEQRKDAERRAAFQQWRE